MSNEIISMTENIQKAWGKITPCWPLKNFIAINPLQGFEDLPIEQAMAQAAHFFQRADMPQEIQTINRITIKWLQAFFDEGQATFAMPCRDHGLYKAFKQLAYFDNTMHKNDPVKKTWLKQLVDNSEDTIDLCLQNLGIAKNDEELFLTLMLTTLPGWASYIKYHTNWADKKSLRSYQTISSDYLAIRLIITTLIWPDAADILSWHKNFMVDQKKINDQINKMHNLENGYAQEILQTIKHEPADQNVSHKYDAQVIFCIDVRSQPLRNSLEKSGNYQTFGFAGFFGLPITIHNKTTEESYSSCPVLIKPHHVVETVPSALPNECNQDAARYRKFTKLISFYQSLSYNMTTSLMVVDLFGCAAGLWMLIKTVLPKTAAWAKEKTISLVRKQQIFIPLVESISVSERSMYAQSALQGMGLTKNFAPIVLLCGHGSATDNNAYASALDCGACAGHHGGTNAQALATILNCKNVRADLAEKNIIIPQSTYFIAAEHNTTTSNVTIYQTEKITPEIKYAIEKLQQDLGATTKTLCHGQDLQIRAVDWAQVRPEWGLARNASFIIGPRDYIKQIDLQGRAFLHSYNYADDQDGNILSAILTAPMIVGQWINNQYLFSTLDNVAFGSGSKVTKNITGKFGMMQGNSSDLMHGLPLQSVYATDIQSYHEPIRLTTIVYAPCSLLDDIIAQHPILQKLFGNGWVLLISIDPNNNQQYRLNRNLTWTSIAKDA
jgi:uncharacterized protein YbcC (UPF0753/DUF2309 family)